MESGSLKDLPVQATSADISTAIGSAPTPCVHEHACVKCRFLQVDPEQTGRLEEMTSNAQERLTEARQHHWLGEVSALEESLVHLRRRRDEAEKLQAISSVAP